MQALVSEIATQPELARIYRLLLSGGSLDRNLGTRLVDAILEGFTPRTKRARARRRSEPSRG
jgi:hypothetical protein